ncbi:MAG: two-component system, OmpR family, heavy metal sensor histidine kinase CusS, partial [Burkholderiales bacterium]
MMRSIAARLAVTFGIVALVVFSLSAMALYQALAQTLQRQQEEDLRGKLEVAERLIGEVRSVERWDELRQTLTTITTTDGNTRFWIACENTALNYGYPFPDRNHPRLGTDVKSLVVDDSRYPMKTLGRTLSPLPEFPEIHLVVGVSDAPARQTLHAFAVALVAISACGIVFVAGFGYWVARFGLRPLARLSAGAEALSPKNLSQRLVLSPPVGELSQLTASFNGALDRLETAYAQLEGFSADVAHELRTPIGNAIGMTQVALTRERSADELKETLQSNLEELERLRAIVNDMLFLARADQGETASSLTHTTLASEVQKTIEFLEPLIEEKALSVDTLGDAEASVDKALFRRAMSNLLHNAIQYSPIGAKLRVEMRSRSDSVEVAVCNPGDTIPLEHLTRLFDRFYRIDPSRALSTDNHGLGLAIVKAIAKMHGGTVFANSSAGINTIGLTLPVRP